MHWRNATLTEGVMVMGSSSPWNGLVVICAGTAWDGIPMPERHIAEHLSRRLPVLFVDPPRSPWAFHRDAHTARPVLTILRPGLARLSPIVLPGSSRISVVSRTAERLSRFQ